MGPNPRSPASEGTDPPSSQDRPQYAETEYGVRAYGWSTIRSLRAGKYLFVEAPRRELYDMAADPKAEHDLAATSKAVADTLQGQLDAFRQKTSKVEKAPASTTDPEAQEKLAALGYTATTTVAAAATDVGADPKDKIEIGNMMGQANFLLEDQRLEEAVVVLQKVVAKEPSLWIAYAKLGMAETNLGNIPEAVKAKRKAVELNPDSVNLHYELGKVLMQAADFEAAVPELEFVVAKMPGSLKTRALLAIADDRTNRLPQAIGECEKILAVLPEQYSTNLLLGRDLVLSGKPEDALPRLMKAAAIRPQAPQPHLSLADAYDKLGRKEDAERERDVAKRLAENGPVPGPSEP
jgi:Flp pilus assembly protein TadD